MNIIREIYDLMPDTNYWLRFIDPLYETKLVLEVTYIKLFEGHEFDIDNADNDSIPVDEQPFDNIPYSSSIFYKAYKEDDLFGLFKVVRVVQHKNIPLDLLRDVPFYKWTEEEQRMFTLLLGSMYTESEYDTLLEDKHKNMPEENFDEYFDEYFGDDNANEPQKEESKEDFDTDMQKEKEEEEMEMEEKSINDSESGSVFREDDYNYLDATVPGKLIWIKIQKNDTLKFLYPDIEPFVFTDSYILKKSIQEYLNNPEDSPPLHTWDVRGIYDMTEMFTRLIQNKEENDLLAGIDNWDVSNVSTMESMFLDCPYFNQPLNKWNVSSVENTREMFSRCLRFNQPLDNWSLPIVESMDYMFNGCSKFDQDLNKWRIPPTVTMVEMFDGTMMKKRNHLPHWANIGPPKSEYTECHAVIEPYTPQELEAHHSEIESFMSTFADYPQFIGFIHDFISAFSPNEYESYYSKISPLYFILSAPPLYRITPASIPAEVLSKNPTEPFYQALRYIFSIIPHFAPSKERDFIHSKSTSEHSYMVHLNRLIYYYNLFRLFNKSGMNGFEDTAGVVIYTHGKYPEPRITMSLTDRFFEGGTLDNIFMCTKAPLGCSAYGIDEWPLHDAADDALFDEMYESIDEYSSVPFDELISKKYGSKNISRYSGNCRTSEYMIGRPMNHYIGPNTKGFIEKIYGGNYKDITCYIIDIERFHASKELYETPIDRLRYANLLLNTNVQTKYIDVENGKITDFETRLSDIVKYYSKIRKRNLFVYDTSCGTFADTAENDAYDEVVYNTNEGTQEGHPALIPFIETRSRIAQEFGNQGWGKKRKTHKKKKGPHKTKKNRKNRKTRKPTKPAINRRTKRAKK